MKSRKEGHEPRSKATTKSSKNARRLFVGLALFSPFFAGVAWQWFRPSPSLNESVAVHILSFSYLALWWPLAMKVGSSGRRARQTSRLGAGRYYLSICVAVLLATIGVRQVWRLTNDCLGVDGGGIISGDYQIVGKVLSRRGSLRELRITPWHGNGRIAHVNMFYHWSDLQVGGRYRLVIGRSSGDVLLASQ